MERRRTLERGEQQPVGPEPGPRKTAAAGSTKGEEGGN